MLVSLALWIVIVIVITVIGLYDEGKSSGLSGLGIKIILENFHRSGKYDRRKIELNKWVRNRIAFFDRHLATSAVIKLKPGDFLRVLLYYFCIVDLISFGVKLFSVR
jgi:hypothetical protein